MDEQKIKDFNVEMNALLVKYNVTLEVNHGISIVPRKTLEPKEEKLPEATSPEEAK